MIAVASRRRSWAGPTLVALVPPAVAAGIVALARVADPAAPDLLHLFVLAPIAAFTGLVGLPLALIALPLVARHWRGSPPALGPSPGGFRSRALFVAVLVQLSAPVLAATGVLGLDLGAVSGALTDYAFSVVSVGALVYLVLFAIWIAPTVQRAERRLVDSRSPERVRIISTRVLVVVLPAVHVLLIALWVALASIGSG
jgi:hypothetical protein